MQENENLISFRFKPINKHFWQELVDSTLFFSPPEMLNDPFDCQIDVEAALGRALQIVNNNGRRRELEEIRINPIWEQIRSGKKKVGVCCFGDPLNNALMWSHYADRHEGVCLCYEIPRDFIRERSEEDFLGWQQVEYNNNGLTDWLVNGDLNSPIDGLQSANTLIRRLTVKSEVWQHENEFRIVAQKPGPIPIERAFLKEVCFGLRTPDIFRTLIIDAARRRNPDVLFAEMQTDPERDTGLIAQQLEP